MSGVDGLPFPLLSEPDLTRLRREVATRWQELPAELPWLDSIDSRPPVATDPPPGRLRVVAFNAERGSRFDEIVALLSTEPTLRSADILLLSEVDLGMARSANRHVARDLAAALGMGYAFGIEFIELTKGDSHEYNAPGKNSYSLHGNAILSRWPLRTARVVRLPPMWPWNVKPQARIGGRMALCAEIATIGGAVSAISTHLENRTSPQGRAEQMRALLDSLAAEQRAIIGGDLNTATIDAGQPDEIAAVLSSLGSDPLRLKRPEAHEPLFAAVRSAGFLVDEVNAADVATQIPVAGADPAYWLKLDWIFCRGLATSSDGGTPRVIPAVWSGERTSDHDCVVVDLESEDDG